MKSTIKIGLGYQNKPVIKIDFEESEDVRDELLSQFVEDLLLGEIELNYFASGRGEGKLNIEIFRKTKD